MSAFDSLMNSIREAAKSRSLLDTFGELSTDRERVHFVMDLPEVKDLTFGDRFCGKSELQAEKYRAQGDRVYAEKGPRNALSLYTTAVKLAPAGGLVLARSYISRSKALLEVGLRAEAALDMRRSTGLQLPSEEAIRVLQAAATVYQELDHWGNAESSLRDALELLRTSQLDNALKAKLTGGLVDRLKHVQKCKRSTGEENAPSPPEPPALGLGTNQNLPAASAALQLAWTQEKGRHVIATRDIKPGTVLIVERPYAWSLSREAMAEHCMHCCKPCGAPLACLQCAKVSYCSVACRDAAWRGYHAFECRILDHIIGSKELSAMSLLAYRIVTTARLGGLGNTQLVNMVIGDSDNTVETHKEPDAVVAPTENENSFQHISFDEDISKKINIPFYSNVYSSVYGQVTNSSSRTSADLLKRAVSSIFLVKCLRHIVDIDQIDDICIGTAIMRHLQSCSCNAYQISEQVIRNGNVRDALDIEIGGATYPTISLCNHSCYPNVVRHSYGITCVVRASRHIKKNEEILDNYGPHFLLIMTEERQTILNRQYFFNCDCRACNSNWPTAKELQCKDSEYKCINCKQSIGNDITHIKVCSRCKRKLDYKKFSKKIQMQSRDYKKAIDNLLAGRFQECLKTCIDYVTVLEPVLIHPCKDFVRWQQVLTQCWSFMGNTYNRTSE